MAACDIFLVALTLGLASSLVSALGVRLGRCPTPPSQSGFDLSQYLGSWYEQSNFFTPYELFQKCITATYSLNADNSIQMVNEGQIIGLGIPVIVVGRAYQSSSDPAQLQVRFGPNSDSAPSTIVPNYQVVETDYTSYAVVFNCRNGLGGLFNTQVLWILTRSRSGLTTAELDPILARIQSYGINTNRLRPTGQSNCPA